MRMTQGWEAKAGTEAEAGPGSGGQVLDPTPPGPGLVSLAGPPATADAGGGAGEHGARRHAAPETKGRRRRGLGATSRVSAGRSGQMLAAGAGGPARPVSSRSAAWAPSRVPARARPPAEGAGVGRRGGGWGAPQGLGGSKRLLAAPAAQPAEKAAAARCTHSAVGGGGEERHPSLGRRRSAQPI